jgi:hypothetical protein
MKLLQPPISPIVIVIGLMGGCNNYKTTFEKLPMKFQFLSFSEQIMRSLFGLRTNIPGVM